MERSDDISDPDSINTGGLYAIETSYLDSAIGQIVRGIRDTLQEASQDDHPITIQVNITRSKLLEFCFELLKDPYLCQECIIVYFDNSHGDRLFGIAREADKEFWLSEAGKKCLNSKSPLTADCVPYFAAIQFNRCNVN